MTVNVIKPSTPRKAALLQHRLLVFITKELLAEIQAKGVHLVYLTLSMSDGTFRPVSVDNLGENTMHSEFYQLSEEELQPLRAVKENVVVVIALGEPPIRTLETIGSKFDGNK